MKKYENVILASASPRRQELLKLIFDEFEIEPAEINESRYDSVDISFRTEQIARAKAKHVAASHPNSLVIGCDTTVEAYGRLLGKPADSADALRMLRSLSDYEHTVSTGVCLILAEKERSFVVKTKVKFYKLSELELAAYLETGDWADKAGAYGIQGKAGLFVESITGDYNNVVGLPCARLNREIREFLK